MSIKKIFWSMLAGMSLALAGCDDENPVPNPPEYGPPPDYSTDDLPDQAGGDVLAEDAAGEDEEELPAVMYGPAPEYGPTPP